VFKAAPELYGLYKLSVPPAARFFTWKGIQPVWVDTDVFEVVMSTQFVLLPATGAVLGSNDVSKYL